MTKPRVLLEFLVCVGAFAGLAASARAQTTALNEWTWMGGSSSVPSGSGQPGIYGTLGTAAAGNIPGGRDSAATWTDSKGNFWLFGGEGIDVERKLRRAERSVGIQPFQQSVDVDGRK